VYSYRDFAAVLICIIKQFCIALKDIKLLNTVLLCCILIVCHLSAEASQSFLKIYYYNCKSSSGHVSKVRTFYTLTGGQLFGWGRVQPSWLWAARGCV